MSQKPISDETLMAYVDGELDPAEMMSVADALDKNPGLKARIAVFEDSAKAAQAAHAGKLEGDVPAHLVESAEKVEAALALNQAVKQSRKPFSFMNSLKDFYENRTGPLIATGLACGALLYVFAGEAPQEAAGPDTAALPAGCDVSAFSDLLETGTSGSRDSTGPDCAVAVVATFKPRPGEPFCRAFQIAAAGEIRNGISCRTEGADWTVEALAPPELNAEFTTATGTIAGRSILSETLEEELIASEWQKK